MLSRADADAACSLWCVSTSLSALAVPLPLLARRTILLGADGLGGLLGLFGGPARRGLLGAAGGLLASLRLVAVLFALEPLKLGLLFPPPL